VATREGDVAYIGDRGEKNPDMRSAKSHKNQRSISIGKGKSGKGASLEKGPFSRKKSALGGSISLVEGKKNQGEEAAHLAKKKEERYERAKV